jgi:hypothetical protein
MRGIAALAAVLLASNPAFTAPNVGAGFGESLWALTSARQAGSGGLAIEDPWREGSLLETSTVLLNPGMRWFGLGWQGGVSKSARAGLEIFSFTAQDIPRTVETAEGNYGGKIGTFKATDYGGRAVLQHTVLDAGGMRVAVISRASGMFQELPGASYSGAALEMGAQVRRDIGPSRMLNLWALAGPLGKGGGRWFTGQFCAGGGFLADTARGVLGGNEGYSVGAEGTFLGEGLLNGGLGAIYWFGRPNASGLTLLLRGGARVEQASIASVKPQGGLGLIWRGMGEFGLQFDYAAVSLGPLGYFQYATIGVRLPPPPKPATAAPPSEEPVPVKTEEPPFYFYPRKGEKAAVPVNLQTESMITAVLMDLEGRPVRRLIVGGMAPAGTHEVVWDGRDENGMYARFGATYFIVITTGSETFQVRVVPLQEPCIGADCEK